MSTSPGHPDAARWDKIYREQESEPEPPAVLALFTHLLPATGRALDIACGLGAGSLLLARHGLRVDAVDISGEAIRRLQARADSESLPVNAISDDIGTIAVKDPYDVILVSRFLDRSLLTKLSGWLAPGGLLYYQTFTREKPPGMGGPSNPDYLLAPGELIDAFGDLAPRYYLEEGLAGSLDSGTRGECRLIAQREC